MNVTNIASRRRTATVIPLPESARRGINGTVTGLGVAFGLISAFDLPDCTVHVWDQGSVVVLDYTGPGGAGSARRAAEALGWDLEEHPSRTEDGSDAIELRAATYQDGILRVVRAVVKL